MTEWHVRYGGKGIMIYWHVEKHAACICVEKVGSVLAAHFPPDSERKDDLSDAVFEG